MEQQLTDKSLKSLDFWGPRKFPSNINDLHCNIMWLDIHTDSGII